MCVLAEQHSPNIATPNTFIIYVLPCRPLSLSPPFPLLADGTTALLRPTTASSYYLLKAGNGPALLPRLGEGPPAAWRSRCCPGGVGAVKRDRQCHGHGDGDGCGIWWSGACGTGRHPAAGRCIVKGPTAA